MPLELWGAAESVGLSLPQHPLEYLLSLLYVSLLVYIFYLLRKQFQQLTKQDWYLVAGLAVSGLITSQLFPIHLIKVIWHCKSTLV